MSKRLKKIDSHRRVEKKIDNNRLTMFFCNKKEKKNYESTYGVNFPSTRQKKNEEI